MKNKICIVTSGRADYSLLKKTIFELKKSKKFKVFILATGMHLSKKFGYTINEIVEDGLKIKKKINILLDGTSPLSVAKSFAIGTNKFTKSLSILKPDIIIILGDRFEILSIAIACLFLKIPVCHIHGGEITEGAFDNSIRNAITKLSHIHFTATTEFRRRVIQLGEKPENVHAVGGLGVDNLYSCKYIKKQKLEKILNIRFLKKNLLINFHPTTLEDLTPKEQILRLLRVLKQLKEIRLIFTLPNCDPGGQIMINEIKKFVKHNKNSIFLSSLGQRVFFSCLIYVDGVIGNSSSGILEVPYFKKPTINIGDRQKGRPIAKSVINCSYNSNSIKKALKVMYSKKFQSSLKNLKGTYGRSGASVKISRILEKTKSFENIIKKPFFDLHN